MMHLPKNINLVGFRCFGNCPVPFLSWHRDPEPRLHIPIVTNFGARMCIDNVIHHMPADGGVWTLQSTQYHARIQWWRRR